MRTRRNRKKQNTIKRFVSDLQTKVQNQIDSVLFDLARHKIIEPSMNFTTLNGRKARVLTRLVHDYMTDHVNYGYLCLDIDTNNTFVIGCMPLDNWKDAFIPDHFIENECGMVEEED